MPRIKANLPGTPWTKVPNDLFDRLMPTLRDTELRVLLALVRATSGWNREGRPALLTYRALTALTGRQSEAVANAIAALTRRGLIHILGAPARRFPKKRPSEIRAATNKKIKSS